MTEGVVRLVFAHVTALLILVGTFYALVLHPFVVETDVKLFLTGLSGTAALFIFGDQVAARARANTRADLATPPPVDSVP